MTNEQLSTCLFVLSTLVNIHNAQMNIGCEGFRNGSCCPNLQSVDQRTIREVYSVGPLFVTFVPVTTLNLVIDNICYYISSLPDDSNTFLLSISRVFFDGRNDINSYLVTQPQIGVTQFGSSQCSFLDIPFAFVTTDCRDECDIILVYRCVLSEGCGSAFDVTPPVFGISYSPRPISTTCIQEAKNAIRSFGFPDQDYITYPSRLRKKCVFRQQSYCFGQSKLQGFRRLCGL